MTLLRGTFGSAKNIGLVKQPRLPERSITVSSVGVLPEWPGPARAVGTTGSDIYREAYLPAGWTFPVLPQVNDVSVIGLKALPHFLHEATNRACQKPMKRGIRVGRWANSGSVS